MQASFTCAYFIVAAQPVGACVEGAEIWVGPGLSEPACHEQKVSAPKLSKTLSTEIHVQGKAQLHRRTCLGVWALDVSGA